MPLLFLASECRVDFRPRWATTALLELQERPRQEHQRLARQQQVPLRLRQERQRLEQQGQQPVHQQPVLALA